MKSIIGGIYYTDCELDPKIANAVQRQLIKCVKGRNIPIISTSLKPIKFGQNIVLPFKRGYEAYFKQILTALEASTTDIVMFLEHDWLYNPSHFEFTPLEKDVFYYNWNWWRVRSSDGHAVHYDTQMVPGLVAYREILLDHYRNVVNYLEKVGFTSENARQIGFEPGTTGRAGFGRKYRVERFDSKFPIIDIRHENNLTSSKWSQDAFRNPKNAQGWIENDSEIPFWGKIYGRFDEFIKNI